jgi:hypothetical protein
VTRPLTLLLLASVAGFSAGLEAARAERNLEKRSRLALENASDAISRARTQYAAGHYKEALAAVEEVRESVELSLASLNATGKSARRSPKHFKYAEKATRELSRRLQSLELDFGIDDRPAVRQVEKRLQEIHDDLLSRIMGRKK